MPHMGKEKVSMIVPVYNGERWIEECMNSLITQTYDHIEIIMIDDGSSDRTLDYIRSYANKDQRIVALSQSNQGVSRARNKGLAHCTGEFICFVDSDDVIHKDYCKAMMEQMSEDIDIVVCGVEVTCDGAAAYNMSMIEATSGEKAAINILNQKEPSGFIWNKLLRASLFAKYKIEFPAGLIYEDLYVSYKCFLHARKVQYIDNVLYSYRRHPNSLCTNYDNPSRMTNLIAIIKEMAAITPSTSEYRKPFKEFLYDSLVRLNNYYIRSDYKYNDIIFKECAGYLIDLIQKAKDGIDAQEQYEKKENR